MNRAQALASFRRGAPAFLTLSLSALLVAPAFGGCSSTSTPGTTMAGPKGNIVLGDQNNYTSQSTLTIPTIQTAPGMDLSICWDGLGKDILCYDLVPATDVDNISFLQILNLTPS